MKKKITIISLCVVSLFFVFAQDDTIKTYVDFPKQIQKNTDGKITIYQNSEIDKILEEDYNEGIKKQSFQGYRIQIFSGNSAQRTKALTTKQIFKNRFPYMKIYLEYEAPTFRIKVGNFRTKLEAIQAKHKIEEYYPKCYIVNEEIKFSALEMVEENTKE